MSCVICGAAPGWYHMTPEDMAVILDILEEAQALDFESADGGSPEKGYCVYTMREAVAKNVCLSFAETSWWHQQILTLKDRCPNAVAIALGSKGQGEVVTRLLGDLGGV